AGVAGLQAVATAKRLGAAVEAFDVRKVVRGQVESLGAKFVEVDMAEDAQAESGYAKEVSEEYKKRQAEIIHRHIAKSDVCITTALIPGQRAPVLITEEMVRDMRPGSVIVDLAAEQGGNCALTEPGTEVVRHGVAIIGRVNLPSRLAVPASQMYSRNMEKFLLHLLGDGGLKIDFTDEITRGCVITHGGEIVHPKVRELLAQKGAA
ncbi:MAG: NAD(P)(+) transhydrogenase (Re/Si-specific) subunit alpha, partial [Candidatus Methylomirabilis sp.]